MKSSFLVFFFCLNLFAGVGSYAQIAPEANPHRGIYADHFLKIFPSGEIDPSVSILSLDTNRDGIFEQEDALLKYCAQNHITYLALYDLYKIIGRNRLAWNENTRQWEDLEKHLCRFIKKAKEEYCIDQIGAAGGSEAFFDSLANFMNRFPATTPYHFRPEQLNSPAFDPRLRMVEQAYPEGSREEQISEFLKFYLRITDLNECGSCGADIDVLNAEVEFWYTCASDYPSFADLLQYMYAVKQLHNSLHPDQPVMTEVYLANLTYCSSPYSLTDVVHLIDGCSYCAPCPSCTAPHPRLIDRTLFSFLTGNPTYFTHYATSLFADTSTADSSDFHPLLYAESVDLGGFTDYLGAWFPQYFPNNIFAAEMNFYGSWRNLTTTDVSLPSENNIQPGGAMWFARRYMVDPLNKPLTYYSSSPRCTGTGTNAITFVYNGPPEIGSAFSFWVSRDSDNVIIYPPSGSPVTGITTSYLPAIGPNSAVRSIDFSNTAVFPPCVLPLGTYTAHLRLDYEGGDRCGYLCEEPVMITDRPRLTVWGDTVFCEGHYAWLRATGGTSYQWYRDGELLPGAIGLTYKALQSGNYYCSVSSSGNCNGTTDTVFIHVKPNPMLHINGHCNGNNTVTLIANARDTTAAPSEYGDGGVIYKWSTGATTDRITVNFTGENYRLIVTDPYSGCSRYDDLAVPASPSQNYSVSIQQVTSPSGSCIADGSLQCIYTPSHTLPVSYLWNTGQTSYSVDHLYPGTYSVITSVYDNACSYFVNYTMGPLPGSGPLVTETITPVSCHGNADGAIQLILSGGSGPFTFAWESIPLDSIHNPSSQNQDHLYPGSYTVNIFDSNGCRFQQRYTVPVTHARVQLTVASVTPVTLCATNSDGEATVSASGGTVPYQYRWNDPALQNSATAVNLPSGTWRALATDANGCSAEALVSIPSSPPMHIDQCDTSFTYLTCPGDSSGFFYVCLSGGSPPYSVSAPWTLVDSIHAGLAGLSAGTYSLTITDQYGCSFSASFAVNEPPALLAQSTVMNTTCSGCADGSIDITMSGGTGPYVLSVSPVAGTISGLHADNLPGGIYTCCIEDALGCRTCFSDTILEDPLQVDKPFNDKIQYNIYPNPSGANAGIGLRGFHKYDRIVLQVTDLAGRVVEQFILQDSADQLLKSRLKPGLYITTLVVNGHPLPQLQQKWLVHSMECK